MGLIKAALGSAGGVLADQWKEYFYCDALAEDILVAKGKKRVSGRSSNTKGEDNIISSGSVIAVNEGQCMMIVEQGKVVEVVAEAGEFVYDSSTSPTIFAGSLGDSILSVFKEVGKRFSFGGGAAADQRVYYFNTKEIMGNKYGTPNPVPFRVVDNNIGLDVDISIRCHGEYSYKIVNPLLFYVNVCGNITENFHRSKIDSQLKTELMTALQPAFARISGMGIRYSALPGHTYEISEALNQVLSSKWSEARGIAVASFGINSVKASEEDEQMIKDLQRAAVMRNPNMAAATLVEAQAQAMKDAAKNTGGSVMAFAGMNMAQQAGGMNAQQLFNMGGGMAAPQQDPNLSRQYAPGAGGWKCSCGTENTGRFCMNCGSPKPEASGWKCSCGTENTGKFCMNCGKPKPAPEKSGLWKCSCGTDNTGKFCMNCGSPKPSGAKAYKCNKCGWQPEDKANPPKFCPQCGDIFNDDDLI